MIPDKTVAELLYDQLKANGVNGRIMGVQFIRDQYVRVFTTHGVYTFDTMQFPTAILSRRMFSAPRRWLLTVWFWLRCEWSNHRAM